MSEIRRKVSALFVVPADQTQKYFTYWNPKTILKIKRSFGIVRCDSMETTAQCCSWTEKFKDAEKY